MDFRIAAQGFKLTPAIREYALERILPQLDKHVHQDGISAAIHLRDLSGPHGARVMACEVVVSLPRRHRIQVEERATELYAAISKTAVHLGETLNRDQKRTRTLDKHRGRAGKAVLRTLPA